MHSKFGRPVFCVSIGYIFSIFISLLFLPVSYHLSLTNSLPLHSLTVFAFLSLLDLGLPRYCLYLQSVKAPVSIIFCVLIFSLIYSGLCSFLLLLFMGQSLFIKGHLLLVPLISIVLSIASSFNIIRLLCDGRAAYLHSSALRIAQSLLVVVVPILFCKLSSAFSTFFCSSILFIYFFYCSKFLYSYLSDSSLSFISFLCSLLPTRVNLVIFTSNKRILANLCISSFIICMSNLGERFLFPIFSSASLFNSYLALIEYASKALAIGTIISTLSYPYLSSSYLTFNLKELKYRLSISIFFSFLASSTLSFSLFIVYKVYLPSSFSELGASVVLSVFAGAILNSVYNQISNYLEAVHLFSARSKSLAYSSILTWVVFLLLLSHSSAAALMLYWFYKGVSELLVSSVTLRFCSIRPSRS